MKKIFVLLVILFTCTLNAYAQEPGYVSVSSEVVKEVQPNFASFNVIVEKNNINKEKAVQDNNKTMAILIAALKKHINAPDRCDLKTTSFIVEPRYNYIEGKTVFDKYNVRATLNVSVEDLDKLGELVEIAIKNGATTVNGLNFSLKSSTSYCEDIIKEANLENLRKANSVASTMNMKVTKPRHINVSCSQQTYYAGQTKRAMASVTADSMNNISSFVPVEKGNIKIYATVSSEFYIK